MMRRLRLRSTLFPYTTLFRSFSFSLAWVTLDSAAATEARAESQAPPVRQQELAVEQAKNSLWAQQDRKSTRLNSSHMSISYAVFFLKKKTINCSELDTLFRIS